MAVDSTANLIYICNTEANAVSVINGKRNKVVATIDVGQAPKGIGFNPITGYLYVANSQDNTVSVIDVTTRDYVPILV
jgi:YVTN family beta-propeller protein